MTLYLGLFLALVLGFVLWDRYGHRKLCHEVVRRPHLRKLIEKAKAEGVLYKDTNSSKSNVFKKLSEAYNLPYRPTVPLKDYLDELESILVSRAKGQTIKQ
jgi:hypothetical protein